MAAPITLIRFSPGGDLIDRLNKSMLQIHAQLQGLQNQIDKLKAAQAPATSNVRSLPANEQAAIAARAAGKPGYPGVAENSAAIIQGPSPGGPSPIPPWIADHTMIVGEGSKPVKLLTFTDGQIPISATGADPAAANISPSNVLESGADLVLVIGSPYGIGVDNGTNSIQLGFAKTMIDWITKVSSLLLINKPWLNSPY